MQKIFEESHKMQGGNLCVLRKKRFSSRFVGDAYMRPVRFARQVALPGWLRRAAYMPPVIATQRANRVYGFPLWGKLSPQVTDEGATSGHIPLIRRVPRHLLPKGEGFSPKTPAKVKKLTVFSKVFILPFAEKIGII